jgi:hypothetical protein
VPASFDAKEYEERVLKPLRRRSGGLPDDLLLLYDMDPAMSGAQIEERLRKVRSVWTQRSGGVTATAKICQLLLSADAERKQKIGASMTDPAWWSRQAASRDQAAAAAMAGLTADLKAAYGSFGLVTTEQAQTIGRHAGLSPAQVTVAVGNAGLREVPAVVVPSPSLLSRGNLRTLREKLAVCGAPTVVHLLHPDLAGSFRLATGFAVPGKPGARLDDALLREQTKAAEAAADSPAVRARKEVLGLLRTLLSEKGAQPATVALAVIVDELREQRAAGLPPASLASTGQRRGLAKDDAAVLVASLLSAEAGGPARPGADHVRDLLAEGKLREARALLIALPTDIEGRDDVSKQLAEAESRVQRLIADARAAIAGGREDEAERLLADAAALSTDDETIVALWGALPPVPPRDLALRVHGSTVELGWRAASTVRPGVRYRVRRAPQRVPVHQDDGDLVDETESTNATDTTPPSARSLRYAVFATVDGTVWSRASAGPEIIVVPPVSGVVVHARAQEIELEWDTQPGATVRVRRSGGVSGGAAAPGRRITTASGGCVDRDVETGSTYRYAIVARYPRADGAGTLDSEPVEVEATAQAEPLPVVDLAVGLLADGTGTRVELTWSTAGPGSADAIIRRGSAMPSWEPGARIPAAGAQAFGREVQGVRRIVDGQVRLVTEAPTGRAVYVPFSGDATSVIVGVPRPLSIIEPVSRLQSRRHADHVVASWVWPPDTSLAQVNWRSADGDGDRLITLTQYHAEGGCRIPAGPGAVEIDVVARTTGQLGASAPSVRTSVAGRPVRLTYTIDRLPGLRGRTARRTRVVTVSGAARCEGIRLVVIAAPGSVMPLRPDAARRTVLADRSDVVIGTGHTEVIEVEVPPTMRRPYWLRCFLLEPAAGVTLVDPPADTMKVD